MDLIRGGAAVVVAGLVALVVMLPHWLVGADPPAEPRAARGPSSAASAEITGAGADLARVAALFVDFARGDRPLPPSDGPVDVYVGGLLQRRLESVDLLLRDRWQVCPQGGYAARTCPFSPLVAVVGMGDDVAFLDEPPRHPCLAHAGAPEALTGLRGVTITTNRDETCTSYVAVRVYLDDAGLVVAVDLALAQP